MRAVHDPDLQVFHLRKTSFSVMRPILYAFSATSRRVNTGVVVSLVLLQSYFIFCLFFLFFYKKALL